ncbi:hypothetical protein protein [Bacillus cereus G9241]|nr:hypothetical protein protein [Bacillus cereus G9241]
MVHQDVQHRQHVDHRHAAVHAKKIENGGRENERTKRIKRVEK